MNTTETLKAQLRAKVGSRGARKLRAEGQIPCAIGADEKHEHQDFSIEEHGFLASRRRHVHLFEIEIEKKLTMAVVRELQWDTFGEQIIHIDFKRVQRDVATESDIELEFVGHPKGGILNHLITHVKVSCIPSLIPDTIEVMVTGLEMGGVIYGRDLKAPEGVRILIAPDVRVAAAVAIKAEAEAPAAAADGAAPATPAS